MVAVSHLVKFLIRQHCIKSFLWLLLLLLLKLTLFHFSNWFRIFSLLLHLLALTNYDNNRVSLIFTIILIIVHYHRWLNRIYVITNIHIILNLFITIILKRRRWKSTIFVTNQYLMLRGGMMLICFWLLLIILDIWLIGWFVDVFIHLFVWNSNSVCPSFAITIDGGYYYWPSSQVARVAAPYWHLRVDFGIILLHIAIVIILVPLRRPLLIPRLPTLTNVIIVLQQICRKLLRQ